MKKHTAAFYSLAAASCGFSLAGVAALWRMPRMRSGNRSDVTRRAAELSVIIPARNEEQNLPRLLASIHEQSIAPREIIVIDDGSSDQTAASARNGGARVIAAPARPAGWTGKTWACWTGARQASGNLLLFLDADVWFEPDGLEPLIAEFAREPGAVSVLPYQQVCRPYEQLSAFFSLMMAAGTGGFMARAPQPAGMFGPCLLCDRNDYERIGGHQAVRASVLEHLMMGPLFRNAGIAMRLFGGRGALSVRMYANGVRDLAAGWAKGFSSGAAASNKTARALSSVWLTGAMLAIILAAAAFLGNNSKGVRLAARIAYGMHVMAFLRNLRMLGSYSPLVAAAFPGPLCFFIFIFAYSAFLHKTGRAVQWKGRKIAGTRHE